MVTADTLGAWLLKRNGDTSDIAAPAARPKTLVNKGFRCVGDGRGGGS